VDPFDECILKFLGDCEKEELFRAFKHCWLLPQHFKVAPRKPGGQRPGFEGENAQERPWKTHVDSSRVKVGEGCYLGSIFFGKFN